MKRNSGTAEAILEKLAAGPQPWAEIADRAKELAGARMALSRLQRRGLIEVSVRLTPAGRKAARGAA